MGDAGVKTGRLDAPPSAAPGSAPPDSVPGGVPFPRYSIGLLQSESEMLQAPEFDLSSFLEADPHWDFELYTERNVVALLESAGRFDCIVVGYNAAHKSRHIREALRAHFPDVGLCILHQLKPEAMEFLEGDVSLRLRPAGHGGGEPVFVAAKVDPRDEILLNWPEDTSLARPERPSEQPALRHSVAHVGLVPGPDARWRTVLEVRTPQQPMPALVRTDSSRWPPLAVSTALLAPRHETHRALLVNMLLWCASGRPGAVVVQTGDGLRAKTLHRKMRLQGSKAIVHPLARESDLDFEKWPFRGTTNVLLPEEWDPTTKEGWPEDDPRNARPWLSRGGRIAVLGPGDGLTMRHGESDVHWVAMQWATWFNSNITRTAAWHGNHSDREAEPGSVVATRGVLRMLAALGTDEPAARNVPGVPGVRGVLEDLAQVGHPIDRERLGLPLPTDYLEPVQQLLRARIGGASHVEGTVSATVAALDIDSLLGKRALGSKRDDLEEWLRSQFDDAALEDKLEIARALGDADMLRRGVDAARVGGRLATPPSTVLVTAVRSATVACGLDPAHALDESITRDAAVVRREMRMSPLLAANFLVGMADLRAHWSRYPNAEGHPLVQPSDETVDRAVITIGKHGPLLAGEPKGAQAAPEMISTEALALIAYFGRYRAPTHEIGGVAAVPPQMVLSVLMESEALRRQNEEYGKDAAALRLARSIVAVVGQLLVFGVIAGAWWFVATNTDLGTGWEIASFTVASVMGTLAMIAALNRLRLRPAWAGRLANLVSGGFKGLRERFGEAAGRGAADEEERRPEDGKPPD